MTHYILIMNEEIEKKMPFGARPQLHGDIFTWKGNGCWSEVYDTRRSSVDITIPVYFEIVVQQ